jgi:hypothetical protein
MSHYVPGNAHHGCERVVVQCVKQLMFCLLASLTLQTAARAQTQLIRGHIPAAVATQKVVGHLDGTTKMQLVIGLKSRDEAGLERRLKDLFDPASDNFRHFMTPAQFTEAYAPSVAAFQALRAFALRNNLTIENAPANRAFLHVSASAAVVEKVFHLTLQTYQHPSESRTFYAPNREPSVDQELSISHISGLDNLVKPHSETKFTVVRQHVPSPTPHSGGPSDFTGPFSAKDLRAAYAPNIGLTGTGQTVGLLQFDGYYAADIKRYEAASGLPDVPIQNVFMDGFTGVPAPVTGSFLDRGEPPLDIQMVIAMAPGISKLVIYGVPGDASALDALNEMAEPTHGEPLPAQLSTSWAMFYDDNIYKAFKRFAAQGQTFFAYAGDSGAYTPNWQTPNAVEPFPPGDYEYVTSVGGTVLTMTAPAGEWKSETVWSGSGGGPSPWFSIPSWQTGMAMSANHGSTTMRNTPDVSMVASNLSIFMDNGTMAVANGTSASTPLWAGFMALVNERAAAFGLAPVGFINPILYAIGQGSSYADSFHDIATNDSNSNALNPTNYHAVSGYDLATGWGTPKGDALLNSISTYARWQVIPGGGTTITPAASVVYENRLFLFGIGIADHHHYVNSYDGASWKGWEPVPGGGTTLLPDAAAVYQNKLFLFGIGSGDHQHYVNTFSGDQWSGWSRIPGGGTTALADTVTVFQNKLFLVGVGINDRRHYINVFDGTQWAGWSAVPSSATTATADSAVVFQNELHLFATGIQDHKHYTNLFDGQRWVGWSAIPGGGTTELADAPVFFGDQLYVFSIGITDHRHYVNRFDGTNWSGWTGASGGSKTSVSDTAVVYQNHIYVFGIGTGDHHYYYMIYR